MAALVMCVLAIGFAGAACWFYFELEKERRAHALLLAAAQGLTAGLREIARGPDGVYAAKLTLKVILGDVL